MIAALLLSLPTSLPLSPQQRPPTTTTTTTARPHVLFLTHTAGFEHDVVKRGPHNELSLAEQQLERWLGPAWDVDSTKDCARINADELSTTHVLVFHTTGELPISEPNKTALFRWIEKGGGFVGLHCATDTLYKCEPYMQLVGAAFEGHPWHQQVRVLVHDEPPVAFLGGRAFDIVDEIYQFKTEPRDAHLCLELDMSSVDASRGKHARNWIAWWKPVGAGRMVYNALGHGAEAWNSDVFRELVREAVRFAAAEHARPCVDQRAFDAAYDAFAALSSLSRADAGASWGLALDGPVLIVDPHTRVALANRSDASGRLNALAPGVWTAELPDELQLANTAVEWNGAQWTMLQAPLPDDARARDVLLVHESYHRLQHDPAWSGPPLPESETPCAHLDARAARTWLRLELRALAASGRAWTADANSPVGVSNAALEALRDALLFRARRRELHPGSAETENALELHEGLAEYTGLRVAYPDWSERIAATCAALQRLDGAADFARNFAYVTVPAYGAFLDFETAGASSASATPGVTGGAPQASSDAPSRATANAAAAKTADARASSWRARCASGESPAKLAYVRYGIDVPKSAQERARLADLRALAHGGAEVNADEERRYAERRARETAERARYAEATRLVLPAGASNDYSFDPDRVHSLEGAGVVYESVSVSDAWGVLDAPGGALRTERGDWVVPAPSTEPERAADGSVTLRGDGYNLALGAEWRVGAQTTSGARRLERAR